jgi:hypothetical protein
MQQMRDDWARVAEFIETEVSEGERVITNTTKITQFRDNVSSGACSSLSTSEIRFAILAPNTQIPTIYGIRPPSTGESSTWLGPNVIVRCGPGIDVNGNLDYANYSSNVISGGASSLTANLLTQDSNTATRALQVALSFAPPGGGASYSNSFRERDRVNPPYNLLDDEQLGLFSCSSSRVYCGTTLVGSTSPGVNQYIPGAGASTVTGEDSSEDVVYLPALSSGATLSDPCLRDACTVSVGGRTVTMKNVEVIVFYDREIRL